MVSEAEIMAKKSKIAPRYLLGIWPHTAVRRTVACWARPPTCQSSLLSWGGDAIIASNQEASSCILETTPTCASASYHTPATWKKESSGSDMFGPGGEPGAKGTKHRERGGWKREGEPRLCVRLGSWPPFPRWPSAPDHGNSCPWRGWVWWVSKVGGEWSKGHAVPRTTGLAVLTLVDEPWGCPLVLLFQGQGIPGIYAHGTCSSSSWGWGPGTSTASSFQPSFPQRLMLQAQRWAVYKAVVANLAICTHVYVLKIEPASNWFENPDESLKSTAFELPALFSQLFSGSKMVSK